MDEEAKVEVPVRLPLDGDLVYQEKSEFMHIVIDEVTGFQVIVFSNYGILR